MTARDGQGRAARGSWSRRGVLAGLIGAPVLLLAACNDNSDSGSGNGGGTGGSASGAPGSGGSSAPRTSAAVITVTPADGAAAASFSDPVKVAVSNGTLSSVRVVDSTGKELAGQLSADNTGWTSAAGV